MQMSIKFEVSAATWFGVMKTTVTHIHRFTVKSKTYGFMSSQNL